MRFCAVSRRGSRELRGSKRSGKARRARRDCLEMIEQRVPAPLPERERLSGLVKQAMSLEPASAPVVDTKREEALHALYVWYREWSKTARAVISKRAYLISLGLAKRKSPKKAAPENAPAAGAAGKTEG